MEVKLIMQITIYKNLKKKVEFDDSLHIYQLKSSQTKIELPKIKRCMQN